MTLTVGLIAAVGVWALGLSLGAAVLLGGILAPTEPVLGLGRSVARRCQSGPPALQPCRGGGTQQDGTAFPFVMLGLGLLGLHELGPRGWRWLGMDLLWATGAGLFIGAALGTLVGGWWCTCEPAMARPWAWTSSLALGLVAVAYGGAVLCLASGFLAVFAAGLALQRVQEQPRPGVVPLGRARDPGGHNYKDLATHSDHASATMTEAVQGFNQQLERLAELALVLLVGAMLTYATRWPALWWFIPLLFLVLRPVAVALGTLGEPLARNERAMVGWFGIRGIGSVYYLMYALNHGVVGALAQQLVTVTLVTVAVLPFLCTVCRCGR